MIYLCRFGLHLLDSTAYLSCLFVSVFQVTKMMSQHILTWVLPGYYYQSLMSLSWYGNSIANRLQTPVTCHTQPNLAQTILTLKVPYQECSPASLVGVTWNLKIQISVSPDWLLAIA